MNDWPADPELDASLRRLVDSELADAQSEGVRPIAVGANRAPGRVGLASRVGLAGRFGLAGVGVAATVVIVVALALRGTIRTQGGGADASGHPSESPSAELASPSGQLPTGSPTVMASPSSAPTAAASVTGRWVPAGSGPSNSSAGNNPVVPLSDGRILFVEDRGGEIYDPTTGGSVPTGPLPSGHPTSSSATLLADGRVLLAGGLDGTSRNVATAYVFDPSTRKFSPTGSMITARWGHTATLLADGRVLIAGGGIAMQSTMDMIASAEIYDPRTGMFSATGSMNSSRDDAAAVRLPDGRVLIAGGGDEGNSAVATADLYDPMSGMFTATGSMSVGLYGHTATLLNDGRVLVAGGNNGNSGETSIEIYDPVKGLFGDGGSSGNIGFYSVAPLKDGRVLFIAGWDVANITKTSVPLTTCELYDPATKTISPAASIPGKDYSVVPLVDGRVIAVGQGWAELFEP